MLCWSAETAAGAADEYSFAHTTQEQTELRVPFELPPQPSQSRNTEIMKRVLDNMLGKQADHFYANFHFCGVELWVKITMTKAGH